MKIHLYDNDVRMSTDKNYFSNMGSFGIVVHGLNDGLKKIGHYSEPDDADFVGTIEGVGLNFKYKDKPSFIINVWDMINVIPNELLEVQKRTNQRILGLSNQVTNLWKKFGVEAHTVMPGIDLEFYKQSREKSEKFTLIFDSFANVRSGFDLAILAFWEAFQKDLDKVRLIVKNTSDNPRFIRLIERAKNTGIDLLFINERISFEAMRDLYSQSYISLNVMRHSSWGLNIQMAAACGCLPIIGDFCPSNQMDVGVLLSPCGEIYIDNVVPHLVEDRGLHNAYGNFSYSDYPRFFDYDVHLYGLMLRDIYEKWEGKGGYREIDTRTPLLHDKWTWENSAKKLVEALSC
jgi:hypothetical protein